MLRSSFVAALLGCSSFAAAQCTPVDCLPQLPPSGGLCASNFLVGRVGQPYLDAISFHVTTACSPASLFDPTLTTASVRITQMSDFTFTNLPQGLSGVTNQASYTPPANGCGSISGLPTEAGVFAATVNIIVDVNAWPFSLTCGGFGPIAQNDLPISQARELVILPDPSFSVPSEPLCLTDGSFALVPTGTAGGTFSGPGVVGGVFDPAIAGPGVHNVKYVVSAQQGAAVAPATDSLEVSITVTECNVVCDADAGTLGGLDFIPCLEPGSFIELVGIPGGDAVVPEGFSVAYVLTQGPDLVIQSAGPEPAFQVSELGVHALHTLVYDPTTFDPGTIDWETTTAAEVSALFVQGGGSICASLDMVGASYTVIECEPPCDADAGTITPDAANYCLDLINGTVVVSATSDGNTVIPDGYGVGYLLAQGPELVIVGLNGTPVFTASEVGAYSIHTMVFDPQTVDPSLITLGETTAAELNALLIQGGGEFCGSLDLVGAPFQVEACTGIRALRTSSINVFPNPNNGDFRLQLPASGTALIELLDLSGRLVFSTSGPVAADGTVDLALSGAVVEGTYMLRASAAEGRWEQRVVIHR